MFNRQELRSVTYKLRAAAAGMRSIACHPSASWVSRFPAAQDPIELIVAGAALATAHVVGRLFNAISGMARRWVSGVGANADAAGVVSTRQ